MIKECVTAVAEGMCPEKGVDNAINKKNLQWKNLKSITTDGGKNICGTNKEVVALVAKAVENDGGSKTLVLHYIIHQESFCGKCPNDGNLDLEEFRFLCQALFRNNKGETYEVKDSELRDIFQIFDTNNDQNIDKQEFSYCWHNWIKVIVRPISAILIIDVQNDFICGTLDIRNCPAKQNAEEVIQPINNLLDTIEFDAIFYSYDWHPSDHVSFIDNINLRKLHESSPHTDPDKVAESAVKIYKGTNPEVDSYSAFWDNSKMTDTKLAAQLKMRNITDVYVCVGYASAFSCIYLAVVSKRLVKQARLFKMSDSDENISVNTEKSTKKYGRLRDVDKKLKASTFETGSCQCKRYMCFENISVAEQRATAIDAISSGFRVILLDDCCRGVDLLDIEKTKNTVIKNHGVVVNSDRVRNMVEGNDRRPELGYKLALNLKEEKIKLKGDS
ncbi:unnamed protein product [Psylliodes chrysocephalus]|uniref:EF-hand domain-containing protein n=1 Tax=Psylliodes chrysocephalus TaxID=3402493 RepID=A0A9P0D9K0_9CUCU|nr:unnamed protein product [Psylliodes chrysocephala]